VPFRRKAQQRLPIEVRQQLLDVIYGGQPFRTALRDQSLTSNRCGAYEDRPGMVGDARSRSDGNPSERLAARYECRVRARLCLQRVSGSSAHPDVQEPPGRPPRYFKTPMKIKIGLATPRGVPNFWPIPVITLIVTRGWPFHAGEGELDGLDRLTAVNVVLKQRDGVACHGSTSVALDGPYGHGLSLCGAAPCPCGPPYSPLR
jgi:hypothetical protein